MPKVIHTNSGMEYWWSGASLVHTTVDGASDLEPPSDVRVYYLAGSQHSPGLLPLQRVTSEGVVTKNPINILDYRPAVRALLEALDAWVRKGVDPPASQFPRVADGTASPREECLERFLEIPGAAIPSRIPQRLQLEFSGNTDGDVAGIELCYPPSEYGSYVVWVSALDEDCNDVAGIHLPEIAIPLGTYAGWNVRDESMGDSLLMTFGAPLVGSTIPFPRTTAEREKTGDPRLSIEERYDNRDDYLARIRAYALDMVRARLLLEEDVQWCVDMAASRWDELA